MTTIKFNGFGSNQPVMQIDSVGDKLGIMVTISAPDHTPDGNLHHFDARGLLVQLREAAQPDGTPELVLFVSRFGDADQADDVSAQMGEFSTGRIVYEYRSPVAQAQHEDTIKRPARNRPFRTARSG